MYFISGFGFLDNFQSKSLTWTSDAPLSSLVILSDSFSIGLKRNFLISRFRMSGLAALINIFRLAVGDQGSASAACLIGVTSPASGVPPFHFITGTHGSADFVGVDFLHTVNIFSCKQRQFSDCYCIFFPPPLPYMVSTFQTLSSPISSLSGTYLQFTFS